MITTTTRTKDLIERARTYHLAQFGIIGSAIKVIFEKGKGCKLWDTDGNEYLDICSFQQCCNLGYDNREIIGAAIEQMNKIVFADPISPFGNVPVIEYSEELVKVLPKHMNHVFYTIAGTESVESALKFAKMYWTVTGKATKNKFICLLRDCYHGCGHLSGSLMGPSDGRVYFGPEAAGVIRAPSYYCYRCPLNLSYPECKILCAQYLDTIIRAEGEDSIAAFIAEPSFGFGGAISPPPEYWPIVRKICTENNILLIADEVLTGFCRTGKMFALENWNIEPDIMTMSKGINSAYLPLGAVGISDDIYSILEGHPLLLGCTNGAQPVCVATARAALQIYLRDNIADHVVKVSNHARARLNKEFSLLPNVGDVSGIGLLTGIELVADKETKCRFPLEMDIMRTVVEKKCWEVGLFPRIWGGPGGDRVAFSPPLIISIEEVDIALDRLYAVLAGLKDIKIR